MLDFIKNQMNVEKETVEKVYTIIDKTLETISQKLNIVDDTRIKYDNNRDIFIVSLKDGNSIFAVISHNSRVVTVEARYYDAQKNVETSFATMTVNAVSNEITETKALSLITESTHSYFISDVFYDIAQAILHPVEKTSEPEEISSEDVEIFEPEEAK